MRCDDLNHSIDFERAREHLANIAGDAYRRYVALADTHQGDSQAIDAAWEAFRVASLQRDRLRRHDGDAIALILSLQTINAPTRSCSQT